MTNRLLTPDEAAAVFKRDIEAFMAEHCKTDRDRWQVLNDFSLMMGGPGIERPPASQSMRG